VPGLKIEVEWLKENLRSSPETKRRWIDADHAKLSIARQCELVGLPRSTWYYVPAAFTSRLEKCGVAISMDGSGRALDNVFVERLRRSVKYEEMYLKDYADGREEEE